MSAQKKFRAAAVLTGNLMDFAELTAELSAADCPLLADPGPLVRSFNALALQLRHLERNCPEALRGNPLARKVLDELAAVRSKLTRQRYLVGFCGPSQIGKSTTLNNVLEVPEADAPAKPGYAKATTCSIMRLYPLAASPHTVTLHYMTPTQYQAMRDKLCVAAGVGTEFTDEELLQQVLPGRRDEIDAGRSAGKDSDLSMLDKLLQSARAHGRRRLQEPAQVVSTDYEDRSRHINHDPPDAPGPSDNLLLDYVEIGFHTTKIPAALEMIDLPGFGQTARDTALTERFLDELDGALIFYRASSVAEAVGEEIFARLRKVFEGRRALAGRVWVVLTLFDSLSRTHLYGSGQDAQRNTVFHGLMDTLRQHTLAPEKVILVSNTFFDKVEALKKAGGKMDRAAALRDFKVEAGDDVPPVLRQMPEFRPAFEELLRDGGVSYLRDLIAGKLAEEVRRQTQVWCADKLAAVRADLIGYLHDLVEMEKNQGQWILDVSDCLSKIESLLNKTRHRDPAAEAVAAELMASLKELFTRHFPEGPDADHMELPRLKARFPIHSQVLQTHFEGLVRSRLLESLYEAVRKEMNGLPAVKVLGYPSVTAAWDAFRQQDRADPAWRAEHRFPGFPGDHLFAGLDDRFVTPLNGATYRQMMVEEKIPATCQQAVHAVRMRIRSHLKALDQALAELATLRDTAVPTGPAAQALDTVLQALNGPA